MKKTLYIESEYNNLNITAPDIGETIVWQCSSMKEFETIVLPCTLGDDEERNVIYLRFHQHTSLTVPINVHSVYHLRTSDGFESFSYEVYDIIRSAPPHTLFLFDSLSELNTSWFSDMMMANFFSIMRPLFAKKQCSGILPILRDHHSYESLMRILGTGTIFMDIQKCGDSVQIQQLSAADIPADKPDQDIYHRYFSKLRQRLDKDLLTAEDYPEICSRLITSEEQMKDLIVRHFSAADYLAIYDRMIGTGRIGGKACGFLLSRKIVANHLPEARDLIAPADAWYVGTDVFYRYMVQKNCWLLRMKQRRLKDDFVDLEEYRSRMASGTFSPDIKAQFIRMLEHYGNTPIIVRSSSFLEDGYGNAFSGKYESVFCPNTGTLEERLQVFEDAVRKVYVSTLSDEALEYRRKRNLLDHDEQMALLIQKVAGSAYGSYYFPLAAGVGFSYNPYRWMDQISPKAGMVRLVAGMGTRAVTRTPNDYPRLVSLDRPQAMSHADTKERHRYSQRYMDVLSLESGKIESHPWEQLVELLPAREKKLLLSHDTDAEMRFRERGRYQDVFFVDCQGIVKDGRPQFMKQILAVLETEYQRPVDVEFALEVTPDGTIAINILQCRPLKQKASHTMSGRKYQDSDIIFDVRQTTINASREESIDTIVIVDPYNYYNTPYAAKSSIAAVIGRLNRQLRAKQALLLAPGRIGTSSPELGVPVSYTEISNFKAICEVAYSKAGYNPELSYGSHMFQDLVEADIFYAAIKENRNTRLYQPEILDSYENVLTDYLPDCAEYCNVVTVYDLSKYPAVLSLDASKGYAICAMTDFILSNPK